MCAHVAGDTRGWEALTEEPLDGSWGGSWRKIDTARTPERRRSHSFVTNSTHLIVFGGKGPNAPGGRGSTQSRENLGLRSYFLGGKDKDNFHSTFPYRTRLGVGWERAGP